MGLDPSFTQLFVARSQRLCYYVEGIVEKSTSASFETHGNLKKRLEHELPRKDGIRSDFPKEARMRFDTFKREVYDGDQGIDPLLVWTSIQSFIKGSIEATMKQSGNRAISEEEFLNTEVFSSGRCSLSIPQRKIVYPIYERYTRFLREKGMWDDCDRILALLLRLEHCKATDSEKFCSIKASKIYVDEVQDYTQCECLLFFYLCDGPDNLFLAGDPAQNIVQGVEFRFQDIRSVQYHISKDKKQVMRKPKKVHVNFRSHAGILKIAGSVLKCMIEAFPKSAEHLGIDHGVFVGPQPSFFENVDVESLRDLLHGKLSGTVVLVHDARIGYWKEALEYPLIRSIRESKGLEFKNVLILDFFGDLCAELEKEVQKCWCDLLLRAQTDGLSNKCPEFEGYLKLLYTAITRSIERLFFVETKQTNPGTAFARWLTTTSTCWNSRNDENHPSSLSEKVLATKNKVSDVEANVMTKDEALQAGMQLAAAVGGEATNDVTASKTLLNQAMYYFELADEPTYKKKVQVHLESIDILANLPPLPKLQEGVEDSLDMRYFDLEFRTALAVEKLFKEGLFTEGRDLCSSLLPYVSTGKQQKLKDEIVNPLE